MHINGPARCAWLRQPWCALFPAGAAKKQRTPGRLRRPPPRIRRSSPGRCLSASPASCPTPGSGRQAEVRARVAGISPVACTRKARRPRRHRDVPDRPCAPLKVTLDISRGALAGLAAERRRQAQAAKRRPDQGPRQANAREYTEAQTDAHRPLAQIASARRELEQAACAWATRGHLTPIDCRARRARSPRRAGRRGLVTPLTRVEQIDPIYVNSHSRPAKSCSRGDPAEGQVKGVADRHRRAPGPRPGRPSEYPLARRAALRPGDDPGTNTIAMRALFRNPHRRCCQRLRAGAPAAPR